MALVRNAASMEMTKIRKLAQALHDALVLYRSLRTNLSLERESDLQALEVKINSSLHFPGQNAVKTASMLAIEICRYLAGENYHTGWLGRSHLRDLLIKALTNTGYSIQTLSESKLADQYHELLFEVTSLNADYLQTQQQAVTLVARFRQFHQVLIRDHSSEKNRNALLLADLEIIKNDLATCQAQLENEKAALAAIKKRLQQNAVERQTLEYLFRQQGDYSPSAASNSHTLFANPKSSTHPENTVEMEPLRKTNL